MAYSKLKRRLLSVLLLSLVAANGWYYFDDLMALFSKPKSEPVMLSPVAIPPVAPPPDLARLVSQMNAGAMPATAEQENEHRLVEKQQVDTATQWLQDKNPEQRVMGAQQLSAYPTAEAEKWLVKALKSDPSEDVRAAAALSLDAVEKLSFEAIVTLSKALEDSNADTQQNALSTVTNALLREERGNSRYQKILKILQDKARSRRLAPEIKEGLTDFLRNQTENG